MFFPLLLDLKQVSKVIAVSYVLAVVDQLDFLLGLRVRIGLLISTNQSKLAPDRDRS